MNAAACFLKNAQFFQLCHAIFISRKMNSMNPCLLCGLDVCFGVIEEYAAVRGEGEFLGSGTGRSPVPVFVKWQV